MSRYEEIALLSVAACGILCACDGPEPPVPASIAVSPVSERFLALGASVQMEATVRDQYGEVMAGIAIGWRSGDPSVVHTTAAGLVTAVANGVAMVTAAAGDVSASATFTVQQRPIQVNVSPRADTLVALEDTVRLSAQALDANGHVVQGAEFAWASEDKSVVTVDGAGLVTSVANGAAQVTASVESVAAAALVAVHQVPASMTLEPDSVYLTIVDSTASLSATVRDRNGHRIESPDVKWASRDTTIVRADDKGIVRLVRRGETMVTATASDSVSASAVAVVLYTTRSVLEDLHAATGGSGWRNTTNWLSDKPFHEWFGIRAVDGHVTEILLAHNGLSGVIPPALHLLPRLRALNLGDNALSGDIPAELGDASKLEFLNLARNQLSGSIPSSLGGLRTLRQLWLFDNGLGGTIPPELGNLALLWELWLFGNDLTGSIPPELGNLESVTEIALRYNRLSGSIPAALGRLASLKKFDAIDNDLTGPIPPELGDLQALRRLWLQGNDLSGAVPPEIGGLDGLEHLNLSRNAGLSGPLPDSIMALNLKSLFAHATGLCAPLDTPFQRWLFDIPLSRIRNCKSDISARAYLTQPVQSLDYPVPLVAKRAALLRVFIAADSATDELIPPVTARFHSGGAEVHTVSIPAGTRAIPTEIYEGDLDLSANAWIPRSVLRHDMELVVEIDPEGTLDPSLGVPRRIPASGRMPLNVKSISPLELTVIPMIREDEPDSSIIEITEDLDQDSELLGQLRTLMPVSGFDVAVHAPVLTSNTDAGELLSEVEALRVAEGAAGYYLGSMVNPNGAGVAFLGGRSSFAIPVANAIAHELGHNFNLLHAPCGGAGGPDPDYPTEGGRIGSWGYDHENRVLVPPSKPDVMGYCPPAWIAGYHFEKALAWRHSEEDEDAMPPRAATLLLWGRHADDGLVLEPAFAIHTRPVLPSGGGGYRIALYADDGGPLFSVPFDMLPSCEPGHGAFAFAVPIESGWLGVLDRITLSGPDGALASISRATNRPTAFLRGRDGEIRGIVRGALAENASNALFSRGIP